ncbi:hypothetical protein AB0E06_10280 [Streptomyces sp. NPDC048109]|uniref:hypothetical protein n=1 Tax=Streptomyces sp. NPDC048109 TaxID=3155482 RepID=UPI00342572DE
MSAPVAVNTSDGTCWTRRAVTRGGLALYAPEGVCNCPEFVMATLAELAEHGIVGSADVLPMPAGPEPKAAPGVFRIVAEVSNADDRDDAVYAAGRVEYALEEHGYEGLVSVETGAAELGLSVLEGRLRVAEGRRVRALGENDALRKQVGDTRRERDTLREQVAELEAERHTTNEALSDAAEQLRTDRDRIAELEALIEQATEFRVWEPGYGLYVRRAPGATGFAVMEARRTDKGRRVWTTAGWQYSALLSDTELFCWPDAQTAMAEARRIMPGAEVREDAEDVTPQVQKLRTLLAGQREQAADDAPHEGPQPHTYLLGRDLPETGGAQ